MENSTNTTTNKAPKKSSNNDTRRAINNDIDHESKEESGWTIYFEDLHKENNNIVDNIVDSPIFSDSETSLISDAGDQQLDRAFRLNFKRRKTKEANLVDEDLEDTATSPVKEKGIIGSIQEDDLGRSSNERLGCFVGRESECKDLKKRGLCLVPLSIILTYIGTS